MEKKYWYAVMADNEDNDWGTGSYSLEEAEKMLIKYPEGYIAVIDENLDENGNPNNPVCVTEIRK